MQLRILIGFLILFMLFSCKQENSNSTNSTINVRIPAEPDYLLPHFTTNTYSNQIAARIFGTLLSYHPKTSKLHPFLVEEIPTEKINGKTILLDYTIRAEANWSDGTPVTGHDFDFSVKFIYNPNLPQSKFLSAVQYIDSVEVSKNNPKQFRVYINNQYFLGKELTGVLPLVQEKFFDPKKQLRNYSIKNIANATEPMKEIAAIVDDIMKNRKYDTIVNCNAYQFQKWETGEFINIKYNKNWWGNSFADKDDFFNFKANEISYKIIPDINAAISTFKSGGIDVISSVPIKEYSDFKKLDTDNKTAFVTEMPNVNLFVINTLKQPVLSDVKNRRVLHYLIDVDNFIKTFLEGFASKNATPFNNKKDYYNKNIPSPSLDIEKAKIMLNENGWSDSNKDGILDKKINGKLVNFSFDLSYINTNQTIEPLIKVWQNNCKKVGIELSYSPSEFITMNKKMKSKKYDLALISYNQSPMPDDPYQIWHTSQINTDGINYSGFGNAESDKLLEQISTTYNENTRKQLYLRFQEMVYDQMPALFLFSLKERILVNPEVKNFFVSPVRPGFFEQYYYK